MIIHVKNFVQGDIKYENKDGRYFVSDADNTMELHVDDEIVWVNKSRCQAWIETGVITELGVGNMPERIKCGGISINPEGECYIGLSPDITQ